jgi:hypothetical protein
MPSGPAMPSGGTQHMLIYFFRDESDGEVFALSTDVTGANIPPVTPHTEWIFLESIDTLKFPEPWDITDFQGVLDRLMADGYYLFQGAIIQQPPQMRRRRSSV